MRLRLYVLAPLPWLGDLELAASTHRDPCRVLAETEEQARTAAYRAFNIATRRDVPPEEHLPWLREDRTSAAEVAGDLPDWPAGVVMAQAVTGGPWWAMG